MGWSYPRTEGPFDRLAPHQLVMPLLFSGEETGLYLGTLHTHFLFLSLGFPGLRFIVWFDIDPGFSFFYTMPSCYFFCRCFGVSLTDFATALSIPGSYLGVVNSFVATELVDMILTHGYLSITGNHS